MLYEQADLDMTFASFVDTYTVEKFRRGAGCHFQRAALLGAYRSKQGNALHPPSESPRHLCSRIAESVIVGYTL